MARFLSYFNLALLLLLGGTVLYQWSRERDYSERINSLQRKADQQENALAVQTEDLRRTREDVEGFKQTVATLTTHAEEQASSLRQNKAQVFELQAEREKLSRQVEVFQTSLDNHKAALVQRDENIRTLLSQRDQLVASQNQAADQANQAITAYNELAAKYDDVVGRFNTLATQYKAEREAAQTATK